MIFKIVLSLALILLALYAYTQKSRSRFVAWSMMTVCILGEIFVLYPEFSNDIARLVGVGRGADLIMYCFIVASLGLILNLHLRLHAITEDMTTLARKLALSSALPPNTGKTS